MATKKTDISISIINPVEVFFSLQIYSEILYSETVPVTLVEKRIEENSTRNDLVS